MPVLMKPNDYQSHTSSNNACSPEVLSVSLASLSSFRKWQTNLTCRIRQKSILHGIPDNATKHLYGLAQDSNSLYRISGHADIYVYKWLNGETKTMPVWGSEYILQADMYWIPSYPLLFPAKRDSRGEVFNIKENDFQCLADKKSGLEYVVASHNNHFGHFLLDNMPGLVLMSNLGCLGIRDELSSPVRYRKGIWEFLSAVSRRPGMEIDDSSILGSYCIRSAQTAEIMGSSIYTNAFLWRMIGQRVKNYLMNTLTSQDLLTAVPQERVFLVRSGNYQSRIRNYDEVSAYLKTRGFCIVDPASMSAGQLTRVLSATKIIISESGSTTLNAVTLGNSRAKVISLNPRRLLKEPSLDMIHGGLPYLFAYCEQVEFVLGETVRSSSIQSSDICYFDIANIASHIV